MLKHNWMRRQITDYIAYIIIWLTRLERIAEMYLSIAKQIIQLIFRYWIYADMI